MSGFRSQFIHTFSKLLSGLPTSKLFQLTNQKGILPFYHSISNQELPHIKHLYKVKNLKQFEKDLDYLLKHFQPIDLDTFLDSAKLSRLTKPYILLSFDDGLVEFYHLISPLLLKKGVPAMCFLNSDFVNNKALFYRYKASLLIEEISLNKSYEQIVEAFFNNNNGYHKNLLSIDYKNKESLDDLALQLNFNFSNFLNKEKPYLTSDQIRELINQGFHFGAHSQNHPKYQFLDHPKQLEQTITSIRFVSKEFNQKLNTFSFPFTDYDVSSAFFNTLNNSEQIAATFGTAGLKKESISNHFQRIPFEEKNLTSKEILNAELFYYLLKQPIGKNLIVRK